MRGSAAREGRRRDRKGTDRSKNRREDFVCVDARTAVTKGLRHPRSLSREIARVCARVTDVGVASVSVSRKYTI